MPTVSGSGRERTAASQRRGVQLGVAAYVIWGVLTVYWRRLRGFDAIELIAWRMACAAVVMATIVTLRGDWATMRSAMMDRRGLLRLAVAATLLSTNWGCYVWAVGQERILETALGYFLAPLVTMALGVVILHEHPTTPQRFAFAAAAVAVIILTVSYGRPPWIALAIASTWSLYALAKRRSPLGPIDSLAGETFVAFLPAVMVLILLSPGGDSVARSAEPIEWVLVLGTGVITAVPLMLFAGAAQSIPFTVLGPLNLIVPVINVALGWGLYGEPMPVDRFVGFVFVWVALAAIMWDRIAHSRSSGDAEVDEAIAVV